MPAVGRYAPAPASFRLPSIFGSSHVPLTRRSASSSPRLSWMNPGKSEVRSPFSRTCPVSDAWRDPLRSRATGRRAGIGSWKLPRACPCSASARAAVPRSASPRHSQETEAERRPAFISPSGLSQPTFPPERAASPFISNRCSGRRFPVARPARRPSRLTVRGSQGRKSNRSMPAHSRFHFPLAGDGQSRGLCRGEAPLQASPSGKGEVDLRRACRVRFLQG